MIKKSNNLIIGFFILGVLTQCSPSQLEELEPYQYYFDKFDEVPVVTVPDREEITYPILGIGGYNPGPAQFTFFEDVFSGSTRGEVSEANLVLLNGLYQKHEGEATVNLSDEELEQLLSQNTTIDPQLLETLSKVMDDPKLNPLLSELTMPTIDGIPFYDPDARILKPERSSAKGARQNSTSPETLVTPCKQAAEESYLVRLGLLNEEMEASIISNSAVQEKELQKLDSIHAAKVSEINDSIIQTREHIRLTALQLNQAASLLYEQKIIDETEFIGLKTFITIWIIQARLDLTELEKQQVAALKYTKEVGMERLETAQNLFLYQLDQNYQASLTSLNKIYEEVLENCHNQGGGSD